MNTVKQNIQALIGTHRADYLLDSMTESQLVSCYLYVLGQTGYGTVGRLDVEFFALDLECQHSHGFYQLDSWEALADTLYDLDGLAYEPLNDDDEEYDQNRQIQALQGTWFHVNIQGRDFFYSI